MTSAETLIVGKLVLTFGVLLGLPLLDLWLMSRQRPGAGKRTRTRRDSRARPR